MTEVVFVWREPGNHHEIGRRVMWCVPRVGDHVAMSEDPFGEIIRPSRTYQVHSVLFSLSANAALVWVYLD